MKAYFSCKIMSFSGGEPANLNICSGSQEMAALNVWQMRIITDLATDWQQQQFPTGWTKNVPIESLPQTLIF